MRPQPRRRPLSAGAPQADKPSRFWRILGLLLMCSALALPLMQAPERPVETLVSRWGLPPSDFILVNGQLVHLRDEGPRDDPVPLVLLHGSSSSLHTWEGWAKALKGQRRVIRFDLPGCGLTGPFGGHYAPDDYSDEALVRFTLDLLDALHIPRATLVGNSMGGEIAWRLALAAPQRVERLVLLDPAGLALSPFIARTLAVARVPVLGWLSERLLPRAMVEASLMKLYGTPERVTPELVDRTYELMLREGNRHALTLRLRQFHPGEATAQLAGVRQPTLILWGDKDQLLLPAQGREFAQRIPGSQLVILPGIGHLPQEEDPPSSLAAAGPFMALQAGGAQLPKP
jgi:pimeloyl-ACP methyl ester carboxylesterase